MIHHLDNLLPHLFLAQIAGITSEDDGIISETPAPPWVDCYYLITAWSPAEVTPAVEATLDEHTLLAAVTGVLLQNESLTCGARDARQRAHRRFTTRWLIRSRDRRNGRRV
jgi:hypothetical protein